jgi:hypothetical protein
MPPSLSIMIHVTKAALLQEKYHLKLSHHAIARTCLSPETILWLSYILAV